MPLNNHTEQPVVPSSTRGRPRGRPRLGRGGPTARERQANSRAVRYAQAAEPEESQNKNQISPATLEGQSTHQETQSVRQARGGHGGRGRRGGRGGRPRSARAMTNTERSQ